MRNSMLGALLTSTLWAGSLGAVTLSPQQVVQGTVDATAKELSGRRQELKSSPKELYALVDRILLPQFDTRYAAQLVLGKHWKTADEAQRKRFIDSFYNFLLRSYAKAILRFDEKNVKVAPAKGEPQDGRAVVETVVRLDDGTTSPVNYSMHSVDGTWKVYDVRIEGVSYVQNYRSQFNEEIAVKGIAAVIARLEKETADIDAGKEPSGPAQNEGKNAGKNERKNDGKSAGG
jgi:phospholipid transport system substrate-binding protein